MDAIDVLEPNGLPARGGLRREIVRRLLGAIFQGELPADTHLIILKLAERFGTSSTPVREALVELESAGIVEFAHNRGAMVMPFGPGELREIYQLRRILEVEATRCVCDRIGKAVLEPLQRRMLKLIASGHGKHWSREEVETDRQFHGLIAAECGSRRLATEIRMQDALVQAIREIVGNNHRVQRHALTEHLAIIGALLAGNADAAAAAMAQHVDSAADVAIAAMFPGK